MKFAKELDDNAVPEWREKYLDYKGAKKKLKAVERAFRSADKTPSNVLPTPFNNSLRDAPIFKFLNTKPDDQPLRLTRSRSDASSPATVPTPSRSTPRPIPINERSPLRAAEDVTTKDGQAMKRYGSIIGTPPEHDDLALTRSNQTKPVSVLELPVAALDPARPKHVQRMPDPEYDRPVSPNTPNPPPSQLAHTGNAYEVRPHDAPNALSAPRLRGLFNKRTNSMPGDARPFVRRMFSVSGPVPKTHDVALEAYREVDFRTEEFFLYLDKQLDKVESFYCEKEVEATERLLAIREQLHILRDRRWEEILAQDETQRLAERGHSRQSEPPKDRRLSSWMGPVDHAVTHIDNAWDKVRGSYVGKTSRKMEELASPVIASRINRPPDRQDYVRRPPSDNVPYRIAKRKLKMAMAEFYRALELLKSYALLNRTAFRKINKKYDKTVNARPTMRYMAKVNKSHFVNSDVIDGQLHAVEDLYSRYFERGNHKVAVNKLRSKIARAEDYTGSIWRQGVLLAAGSVFAVEGVVYGILDLSSDNSYEAVRASYLLQLYAGYFFMVLLSGFFVLDARIFEKNKVNYQFVFEFVRPINWRQLSEIPAYFYFLLGLFMWLNFKKFGGETMYIYWPVILIGLSALFLFAPPPLFYPHTRSWFLYTNWRLLFAGVYPVEFRDFFFGDMFCSLTYSLGNIELFFCLYAQHWSNPAVCNSSNSRLLGFFSTLPGIFRALQCLRRYYDTRNVFPHLVNCGKYTFTILYYVSLSLYRIDKTTELLATFIVFATINAVYCSVWDILMDWSLLDLESKNFLLRDTLAYKRKKYYYAAIPFDVLLRFNWIFYAIFAKDVGHASVVSFFVAFSEVIRRGVWVIFRVENEHCTNVSRSRASRDVPLPYPVQLSRESLIDKSSEAEEARRQGIEPEHASLSRRPTTSGADVEQATTPATLRRRGTFSADSPVMRTLRRVGSTIAAAHAQDYERKRKPDEAIARADSDASSDSDDPKSKLNKSSSKKQAKDRRPSFDELVETPIDESLGDRRDRLDTAEAEDAFTLARR